ncbi:MAG: hypothetical protein ACI4NB_00100 [Candidatus Ornithospirochaeta sp.]
MERLKLVHYLVPPSTCYEVEYAKLTSTFVKSLSPYGIPDKDLSIKILHGDMCTKKNIKSYQYLPQTFF